MDKILDLYINYLICGNGKATATGLSKMTNGEVSHDQITRYLSSCEQGEVELWAEVKDFIEDRKDEECFLIIDDTIAEKPYTDVNTINTWHYSSLKGDYVKGMNILTCLAQYDDASIPINYRIIGKDTEVYDPKTQTTKLKSSKTKNELFRELLQHSFEREVQFKYILADNWFCSKENMNFIHNELNKLFIIGIKSNRLVALSDEDKRKGNYHKISALELKDEEAIKVFVKSVKYPLLLIKKIFTNENGSKGVLYLVTNDIKLNGNDIYAIYQKRWKIEEYHKSIKQNTSLCKSPTKKMKTQKNHVFASICAFVRLEMLKLKSSMNHFALKAKMTIFANIASFENLQKMLCFYHVA